MPRVRIPLNNFSFGEVNPSLSSRTDNAIYAQSGEIIENFYVRPEGGLRKRAGTWLHDSIPTAGVSSSTSNMDVRLEAFEFSDDEKYIIAFDNGGFTPYRVEPSTMETSNPDPADINAVNNFIGAGLGIIQLERITANQKFRNTFIGYGSSGFNTTTRVKYKITLDPSHNFNTNANSNVRIRRGTSILKIDENTSRLFTPANNVFLKDELYVGSGSQDNIGGTKLNIKVQTVYAGSYTSISDRTVKYNIQYFNNGDIPLKFEIDLEDRANGTLVQNVEIILNPQQSYQVFAATSSSWDVKFREDSVKEIWTSGFGNGSLGELDAFNAPDNLIYDSGNHQGGISADLNVGPISAITEYVLIADDYVACPWTNQTLNQFTFVQRGDFMFISHDTWQPVMIVRIGLNEFELRQFEFDRSLDGNKIFQPYYNFQSSNTTLTPSGTTGSVTLTTSADYFNVAHIGVTLRIGETEATITAFTDAKTVTASILGTLQFQLDANPFAISKDSNKLTVTHALHGLQAGATVTFSESARSSTSNNAITISEINGARVIHKIIDENTYQITLPDTAENNDEAFGGRPFVSSTAATTEWYEQSYSSYRGYPQAITFHEDRLWFGGTPSQPLNLWASRTGSYFNFELGSENDDALDIEANIGVQAQIRHLVSNRDLQVLTSEFEFLFLLLLTKR